MPNTRQARQRLADLMEDRLRQLGLRWQDVADAGGLSVKSLWSARQPGSRAAIAPLTRRKIEIGLRWEHGSVSRILGGGDPIPAEPRAAAVPPPGGNPGNPADPDENAARAVLGAVTAIAQQGAKPAAMRLDEIRDLLRAVEPPAQGHNHAMGA
jgi:hypothetical protein